MNQTLVLASIGLVAAILVLGTVTPSFAQNANKPSGVVIMKCEDTWGQAFITFRDESGNTHGQGSGCRTDFKGLGNSYELSNTPISVDFVDVKLELRDFDGTVLHTCFFPNQEHSNGNKYSCEHGESSVTVKVIAH